MLLDTAAVLKAITYIRNAIHIVVSELFAENSARSLASDVLLSVAELPAFKQRNFTPRILPFPKARGRPIHIATPKTIPAK